MFADFLVLLLLLVSTQGEPKLINKKYKNKDEAIQIEFIDTSGDLNKYIDFEVEVIADGFGFLEGPVWINDYVLFTEVKSESIWKYDTKQNEISLWHKYPGCGSALAWNKNFADELWIACMFGYKILQINMTTFDILNEYNHKSYHEQRDAPFQPNDIVIDNKGNVYFTDLPLDRTDEIGARGGVYQINRESGKMTLIQLIGYGPNGIALNNEQSMIVVANFIDVPIEKFVIDDFEQQNWDNQFIRGYTVHPDNDEETGLMDEPFDYFQTNKKPYFDYLLHDKYDMVFDSNGFDSFGNLWQAVYFNLGKEGGQISILRNDGDSSEHAKYIGTILTRDAVYSASNLEQGGDGYMYATCGDYWNDKGSLVRYRLKEYKDEL